MALFLFQLLALTCLVHCFTALRFPMILLRLIWQTSISISYMFGLLGFICTVTLWVVTLLNPRPLGIAAPKIISWSMQLARPIPYLYTLPETNILPLKIGHPKIHFQVQAVSFREGTAEKMTTQTWSTNKQDRGIYNHIPLNSSNASIELFLWPPSISSLFLGFKGPLSDKQKAAFYWWFVHLYFWGLILLKPRHVYTTPQPSHFTNLSSFLLWASANLERAPAVSGSKTSEMICSCGRRRIYVWRYMVN